MQKQFRKQEKELANGEDEQSAVDVDLEALLFKLAEKRAQQAAENYSDEKFERREVINMNSMMIC